MAMLKNTEVYDVLLKTVFGEARGESEKGQKAVAWVIKNRADLNRPEFGGSYIPDVCRHPMQFECWNHAGQIDNALRTDSGKADCDAIDIWLPKVFLGTDPTGGAIYFNNPDKVGYPPWTARLQALEKIGDHQFYKELKFLRRKQ